MAPGCRFRMSRTMQATVTLSILARPGECPHSLWRGHSSRSPAVESSFSCRFRFFSCHFSSVFHMFWYVIIIYFACRNYQRERDCLEILLKMSELSRTAFLSFSLLVGLTILGNFVFYKASLTMNNVNIWNSHHILKVPFMF